MNDQLAERIAIALEQIALELVDRNMKPVAAPVSAYSAPQPVQNAPGQVFLDLAAVCPVHGGNKVVPAGVSARTGKPYPAFMVCAAQGCDWRPPRVDPATPARAVAPSEGRILP